MSKIVLRGMFKNNTEASLILAIPDSSIRFVVVQDKGYIVVFCDDTEDFVAPTSIQENVTSFKRWLGTGGKE